MEDGRGEKRGLGVPTQPDLIPIGCPNLSRLRGVLSVNPAQEEWRRGGGERGEGEEKAEAEATRGAATEESTYWSRRRRGENSRRSEWVSERANERACASVRVSFRIEARQKKCLHSRFTPPVGYSPLWKSERERKKNGKIVYHALLCAESPENVKPTCTIRSKRR